MNKKRLILVAYFIGVLAPLALGLCYSLLYSLGMIGALSKGATLEYWGQLLSNESSLYSIVYTFALSIISLGIAAGIALLLSHQLIMKPKQWNPLRFWLFIPLCVPPIIAGFALLNTLGPSGWLSRAAFAMGLSQSIEDFPRLVNDFWSIGILSAHVYLVAPFLSIWFASLGQQLNIPKLWENSQMLGCSPSYFRRKVFLPLMLRKGSPILLLYGLFFFGTYEVPLLLGRQLPQVVTLFIIEHTQKFDLRNIPVGHAMAVLYVVLVGLSIWVIQKLGKNPVNSQ